jgi:MscS family membrane protein
LSKLFPDVQFLGWPLWQWTFFLILAALAYLFALVSTWAVAVFIRRRETERSRQIALFVTGPARIFLWFLLLNQAVYFIGPSTTIRTVSRSGTLIIIAATWALIRLLDIFFDLLVDQLRKKDQESTIVLLRPVKNVSKVVIVIFAVILWLDNIGFDVGAILAGLGVGGLAVALAAQDTLKNFLGSIMILLDRPYHVGQRIVVKGHDGVVEEIGLRSTKMRLLTGHQTTVPNEEMAKEDIENIGRRPHIRRLTNIGITYDTPPEKIEKALQIIRDILDNHEGMDPEFPPRVNFNEFDPASLNILVLYWYHPPDYWGFLAFNERVNLQIMQEFEKEGIKFAFPTTTTYLTQEDGDPLHITLGGESQLAT